MLHVRSSSADRDIDIDAITRDGTIPICVDIYPPLRAPNADNRLFIKDVRLRNAGRYCFSTLS